MAEEEAQAGKVAKGTDVADKVPDVKPQKKGLPVTLILMVLLLSFGSSFQYGYNLWIINHPAVGLFNETKREFKQPFSFLQALEYSFFSLGGLFGSVFAGCLVDWHGRKFTLLANNIFAVISAIMLSCSIALGLKAFFFASHLIIGLCTGIFANVVPMYLGEIAPINLRGAITMVAQLAVAVGVIIAQIVHHPETLLGTNKGWPIYLSIIGILTLFQIFTLPSFPESPRYLLIQRRNEDKARKALKMLRGRDDVDDEIEELCDEDLAEGAEKKMNAYKLLCFRDLRWHLFSVIILMLGRQFSGIKAAYYYGETIYMNMTGVTQHSVRTISVGSTLVAIFILMVTVFIIDSVGRRILLLIGFGICSICCVLLTMSLELQSTIPSMSYVSTVLVFVFLVGHVIGPSPVPDLIVTELFLQSSRSSAYVVGGFIQWLCSFVAAVAFFYIREKIGAYSFLVYWPMDVVGFIYVFKVLPETKNKTFLEIRRIMATHLAKIVLRKRKASTRKLSRTTTQHSLKKKQRRRFLMHP